MTFFLAFDTSERNASAGVFDDQRCLAQIDGQSWAAKAIKSERSSGRNSGPEKGSSTAIVAMIRHVLHKASVEADQLSAIAFSNGPGTFTGVRVGIVAARMLCYAWRKPMVVVNSLDVAADKLVQHFQIAPESKIWSAVNAQRGDVFAASYTVTPTLEIEAMDEMSLFANDRFAALLRKGDFVTGSGAHLFAKPIEEAISRTLPDRRIASCDAAGVAALARKRIEQDCFCDLHAAEPIYFRPSAAEEVRIANATKLG